MPAITITLQGGGTYTVNPSDTSAQYSELTGDKWVELKFESAEYVEIQPGSSMSFEGETYWVERPQDVKIVHRRNYEYDARFDFKGARLKHLVYVNPDDGRTSFPVTGDANDHLGLIVRAINAFSPDTWTAGNTVYNSSEKVISYDNLTIWEAIELLAGEYGLEFEFVGTAVWLRKVEYNKHAPLSLSYGKGNGLMSGIRRTNYGENPPLVALVVTGGTRNLNTSSGQSAYGSKALHMPAKLSHDIPMVIGYDGEKFAYSIGYDAINGYTYYKQLGFSDAAAKYYAIDIGGRVIRYAGMEGAYPVIPSLGPGTRMECLDLPDIYPQHTHTVMQNGVSTEQKTSQDSEGHTETFDEYTVKVSTTIDYDSLRIPGTTPSVVFQSGMLAGKEFDVVCSLDDVNHIGSFVIVSKFIDDQRMPGGSFVPSPGNKFRVFNCMLPYQYIRNDSDYSGAEWDLAREAVKQLWTFGDVHYTWEENLSGIFAAGLTAENYAKIRIGGYVSFTDPAVQASALLIRITQVKKPLNHPKWAEITLEDYSTLRWKRRIAARLESAQRVEAEHLQDIVAQTSVGLGTHPTYVNMNQQLSLKQNLLQSGVNINTVDGRSILGAGNMYTGKLNAAAERVGASAQYRQNNSRMYRVLRVDDGSKSFGLDIDSYGYDNVFIIDNSENSSDLAVTVSSGADTIYSADPLSFSMKSGTCCKVVVTGLSDQGGNIHVIEVIHGIDINKRS